MFDVAPSEFLLFAIVALVVIGPKDLPKAMRVVGYWVGRARGVARQFRSGFDEMLRESELAEMEKKWAEENARIMSEHGSGVGTKAKVIEPADDAMGGEMAPLHADGPDISTHAITVEKPIVASAPAGTAPAADNKADS